MIQLLDCIECGARLVAGTMEVIVTTTAHPQGAREDYPAMVCPNNCLSTTKVIFRVTP
jgi:hypothetical protein